MASQVRGGPHCEVASTGEVQEEEGREREWGNGGEEGGGRGKVGGGGEGGREGGGRKGGRGGEGEVGRGQLVATMILHRQGHLASSPHCDARK